MFDEVVFTDGHHLLQTGMKSIVVLLQETGLEGEGGWEGVRERGEERVKREKGSERVRLGRERGKGWEGKTGEREKCIHSYVQYTMGIYNLMYTLVCIYTCTCMYMYMYIHVLYVCVCVCISTYSHIADGPSKVSDHQTLIISQVSVERQL